MSRPEGTDFFPVKCFHTSKGNNKTMHNKQFNLYTDFGRIGYPYIDTEVL